MDNKLTEYVLKHSKKHDRELKYDFMPSLLEIIERPAHKAGTVIILSVFSLLIIAVVWACLSKLDVVVTSSGSLQPVGNINVVQSYASGTVQSIHVAEGAYVEAGDVLIELNTEALDIDVSQLNDQKEILETQQEIYTKIQSGADVSLIRVADYDTAAQPSVQAIIDGHISHQNALANLENAKTNADLNHRIVQMQLEQYQTSGSKQQREMQKLVVEQYAIALEQAELAITDAQTKYSAQIHTQIAQINVQLEKITASLEKYRLSQEYQCITAPVSGHVNSISVNTIGAAVSSAQELVTIVPDNAPLEMVCYVQNMDIADVAMGMEAEIKLNAYSYNKYGTVKGTVKYMSPSAFSSDQMGSVYLVKVEITDVPDGIGVISGLSGTVEIKTDQRTVMEYFLEPIMKGFGESLKEK